MIVLGMVLVAFVALQHAAFLVLEMFLWRKPIGLRVFGQSQAQADASAVLASNQGLYNGFLAVGLAWSLVSHGPETHAFAVFFLGCVIVAGVFGAITVKPTILFVQALPAALALAAVLLA